MQNLVPGAVPFPGIMANYGAGWLRAWWLVVWHYTVGTNSLGLIARNGLCAFLIARDGTIYQTAPWDSVNYTQCEWNFYAQGVEVESLDGIATDEQIASLGYLTIFLCNVGALPLDFYPGPERLPVLDPTFRGVTCHAYLHQNACAEHFDGFPVEVWEQAIHGSSTPAPEPEPEEDVHPFLIEARGGVWLFDPNTLTARAFSSPGTLETWRNVYRWTFRAEPVYKTEPEYVALLEDAIR